VDDLANTEFRHHGKRRLWKLRCKFSIKIDPNLQSDNRWTFGGDGILFKLGGYNLLGFGCCFISHEIELDEGMPRRNGNTV
jgi:hypothetical protein